MRIDDLHADRTLDRRAMSSVRGGGAPWVYGWIRPYVPATPSLASGSNFFQINIYADQLINQFQTVDVSNSAPNSNVNVAVNEQSTNIQRLLPSGATA